MTLYLIMKSNLVNNFYKDFSERRLKTYGTNFCPTADA